MDQVVYDYLRCKTNTQIMIEHICPYVYNCIPRSLSIDIRSFHSDIHLLDNMYNHYYRPSVLYTDLMYYMNNTHITQDSNMPAFFYIIRRFHPNQELTDKDVAKKFFKLCYDGKDENILCSRIKIIIGMLTPTERTDFINRYLFT